MHDRRVHVIGIDWAATDEAKCGLALGRSRHGSVQVVEVLTGREASGGRSASKIAEWLKRYPDALLAVDAPLGWPSKLALAISAHVAGEPLGVMTDASKFFSRETDRFVQREFKKSPLEVGADRIARTAFSALSLLAELREATGLALKMAWTPTERGVIEVYPAATLKVFAGTQKLAPYKKPEQREARRAILDMVAREATVTPSQRERAIASDHVLDAIVCVIAGADFASGRAVTPPPDVRDHAVREGWIWVRAPCAITPSPD